MAEKKSIGVNTSGGTVLKEISSPDVNELPLAKVTTYIDISEVAAPAVSPAGSVRLYFDSTSKTLKASENAGAYQDLIAPSASIDGSGIASKIAFWSDSDTLTSDTNLHWDNTNERLGIGIASPLATIHVNKTAEASTRERLLRITMSDNASDTLEVTNATSADNRFSPVLSGYHDSSNSLSSLSLKGLVSAANDASDSSSVGIVNVSLARTDSTTEPDAGTKSAIVNRKLFTVSNAGTSYPVIVHADDTTELKALKIPTGATNNYVLTSDASGNASWSAPAGGIGGSIANTQLAFGSATDTIQGSTNLTYNTFTNGLALSASNSQIVFANSQYIATNGNDLRLGRYDGGGFYGMNLRYVSSGHWTWLEEGTLSYFGTPLLINSTTKRMASSRTNYGRMQALGGVAIALERIEQPLKDGTVLILSSGQANTVTIKDNIANSGTGIGIDLADGKDFALTRYDQFIALAYDSIGSGTGRWRELWRSDPINLPIRQADNTVGFFAQTPIVRQTTTSQTPATFAANTSGIADDSATWNGYSIGDLVAILQAYGLLT